MERSGWSAEPFARSACGWPRVTLPVPRHEVMVDARRPPDRLTFQAAVLDHQQHQLPQTSTETTVPDRLVLDRTIIPQDTYYTEAGARWRRECSRVGGRVVHDLRSSNWSCWVSACDMGYGMVEQRADRSKQASLPSERARSSSGSSKYDKPRVPTMLS